MTDKAIIYKIKDDARKFLDHMIVSTDSTISFTKYWRLENDPTNYKESVLVVVLESTIQVDYDIDRYMIGTDKVEAEKGSFMFFNKSEETVNSIVSFIITKLES